MVLVKPDWITAAYALSLKTKKMASDMEIQNQISNLAERHLLSLSKSLQASQVTVEGVGVTAISVSADDQYQIPQAVSEIKRTYR